MSTEQVDYDTLYDQGYEEKNTDLEQPTKDSEVVEEEEVQEEVEETTETAEESQEATEETQEVEEEITTTEEELYELDYKGEKIKASKEELIELAQKGFDYTSKTQDLSKKRNILELVDGMSKEDVKALVDARNGDKEALSYVAKQAGVDIFDLAEDVEYKPKVEEKNYALDDTINMIKADSVHGDTINQWIDRLPSATHREFAQDPKLLSDLYVETRSGEAQKVMPEVFKRLALGQANSFKEAYLSVRTQGATKAETKQEVASRETIKKATVPKKNVSKHTKEHQDIWEDDDLYQKMQKMRRGY